MRAGRRPSRRSVSPPRHELDAGRVADVRLAFGSVAPTVVRATAAERAVLGVDLTPDRIEAAVAALASELAPDRRHPIDGQVPLTRGANLLREFLTACAQR